MVRKISGKKGKQPIHHLKTPNGKTATTKQEIVNTLAETFEKHSSKENHSEIFLKEKETQEKKHLNFKSKCQNNEKYNKLFTMKDIRKAINKSKDSTTGADNIHYQLLKHIPRETLKILLALMNKIWTDESFPSIWRHAIIIPIPKPSKDLSIPSNY